MTIDIKGIRRKPRLFHNELINVYETDVHIHDVHFWYKNARNILDFDDLENEIGKPIEEIDERKVIKYLASMPKLKLAALKKSIQQNGIRIPLIIRDDGILLDGNRRYFACKMLEYSCEGGVFPSVLENIPAYVIRKKDIDPTKEKKILAEANFVPDNKVEWPIDVRAKVVWDFYDECREKGFTEEQAFEHIDDVYAIPKAEVMDFLATRALVEQFVARAKGKKEKLLQRRIVQDKFVYFWEFCNKAYKGRGAIKESPIKAEVENLFLGMMEKDRFSTFKQVEPMIKASRDPRLWAILLESHGAEITKVIALFNEGKVFRSVEDKIRNFYNWLEDLNEETISNLSSVAQEWAVKLQVALKIFISRF